MKGGRNQARILFVHPDVYACGGAEQVCARMVAVAQRFGQVTLVHCGGPLDRERVWEWYRVALDPQRVKFVTAGSMGGILGHAGRKPILKYALALRHARRVFPEFDLIVGSFGECPIPARRGVQYIHVPVFCPTPEVLRYLNIKSDGPLQARLHPFYVRVSRWLSGWNLREVTRKSTLVNSAWTADVVRLAYGIPSIVAPPAAQVMLRPNCQGWVDWTDRERGFVMLGRIHPSKRLELGIEIIRRVRARGHDVNLHIAGRGADGYLERLKDSVAGMTHVHLHFDLPRPELERLIVGQKFGLHACEYEHYGVASAEMQALGCVVFAPDSAGQREVVTSPDQRYTDADDAVAKISRLLENPDLCARLSAETVRGLTDGHKPDFEERIAAVFGELLGN